MATTVTKPPTKGVARPAAAKSVARLATTSAKRALVEELGTDERITISIHGLPKSGKSTLALTMPKPLVLAVRRERGLVGMKSQLKQILGYDPDIKVIYYDTPPEMDAALSTVPSVVKETGRRSVIVDTATVYGTACVDFHSNCGRVTMEWDHWRLVKGHFHNIFKTLANLPVHQCWVFHSEPIKGPKDQIVGYEPSLVGQAKADILASSNIIGYMDRLDEEIPVLGDDGKPQKTESGDDLMESRTSHRFWVRCPDDLGLFFNCGSHYENFLPGPVYFNPIWADFAKLLGLPEGW